MAEMKVAIDGTAALGTQPVSGTVTANQGTAAATSSAWPVKVSNGTSTVDVAPSSPSSLGNALLVSTGDLIATTTLSAQSSTGAGTVVDYGSAHSYNTIAVTASAGVSAGVVAIEVSQDNTNWFRTNGAALTAPGVTSTTVTGAWRYARGNVTTAITGGTVSATLMAA